VGVGAPNEAHNDSVSNINASGILPALLQRQRGREPPKHPYTKNNYHFGYFWWLRVIN